MSHAPDHDARQDAGLDVVSALVAVFDGLVDPRFPRGIRHSMASVLTIAVFAALAGAKNFREAGDRAKELPRDLLAAACARTNPRTGLSEPPSSATISRVVKDIDADHADARVGAWLSQCVAAHRTRNPEKWEMPDGLEWLDGLAIDGKTVRNSAVPDGINVKLFSALLHQEQVVIAQITVPEDTTEVTCVPALLDQVDLTGKTVTMDAAHTQDATADYIHGDREANYIMTVKGNRPHLLEAIAARMPRALAGSADHTDEEIVGGRRVVREIWVTSADGIDFPGAAQVFRIRRQTYNLMGQRLSKEVVHGISNLNRIKANPGQLLGGVRHHWRIEATHWVRDVVYREDHQRAYTGTGAQVMAMIRNLALAVLRLTGHSEITRTLQRIAADRARILPILANFPLPKSA